MPHDDRKSAGWAWFDRPTDASDDVGTRDLADIAGVAARCFRGRDGTRLLGYLRRLTVERTLSPDVGEAQLRHLEGQRHLVRFLENLIEAGVAGPRPSTETAASTPRS